MHTSLCNESLTLKVGTIQIRQLLRLYPGSWLEAGSIHIPELRINGKFDCHPPSPVNINEQLEFLRRHDQQSQRLHFLYNNKSQQSTTTNLKRPSNFGISTNLNVLSCACLGGSSSYYTLVQGEQFFKSSFRLSEQSSFGRSLFRPDLHVIYSHPIFEQKYNWNNYQRTFIPDEQLNDEEIFYPFDFCTQQKQPDYSNENQTSLSRSNSVRMRKHKLHKRSSSSSAPLFNQPTVDSSSSSIRTSDAYLTPKEHLSLNNSKRTSLNDVMETSSLTVIDSQSIVDSPLSRVQFNLLTEPLDDIGDLSASSTRSSSIDSLNALEEILQRQQTGDSSTLLPQKVNNCTIFGVVAVKGLIQNSL